MWLHKSRIAPIATEMVRALTAGEHIETESPKEVALDLESVLNQYVQDEHDVSERAKDMMAARGMAPTDLPRVRKELAKQKGIQIGDDAIDYLLDQLLEMLMHSQNVDEVYAEDFELRRLMREPLRREFAAPTEVEQEVRSKLKHVQEGTALWEVEYQRMLEDVKRRKGL
ncbi:MAG TPA: DUF507 family protein [Polyangiaceae bacterium]|nr:DUF507 family protein [Polyangiaceae bacterium]